MHKGLSISYSAVQTWLLAEGAQHWAGKADVSPSKTGMHLLKAQMSRNTLEPLQKTAFSTYGTQVGPEKRAKTSLRRRRLLT